MKAIYKDIFLTGQSVVVDHRKGNHYLALEKLAINWRLSNHDQKTILI